MKKFLALLVALNTIIVSYATIRSVNNNISGGAQFSTLQSAVSASVNGDTILISGSTTSYGDITITDKKLAIFGPGFSPSKLQVNLTAVVGTITLVETAAGGSPTGTEIQGLTLNMVSVTGSMNNLYFHRNRFTGGGVGIGSAASNIIIENSYFNSGVGISVASASSYTNFIIRNNVFNCNSCFTGQIMNFMNSNGVIISHNLFYGSGATSQNGVFASPNGGGGASSNLLIENNIFVNRNIIINLSLSTFQNNLTFNCTNNTPWASGSNLDGGGNVAGQDPQMVDQVSVNNGISNPILNFTIASGPANNTANDGKDIGLLFDVAGSLNWDNARNSRIPFINAMTVNAITVAPGGNVSVTVEAKKAN